MIVTSWYVDASFGVNSVPWSEGNFLNETPPAALITVGPENAQVHHLQNEADSCYEVCGLDLDLQFGLILFLVWEVRESVPEIESQRAAVSRKVGFSPSWIRVNVNSSASSSGRWGLVSSHPSTGMKSNAGTSLQLRVQPEDVASIKGDSKQDWDRKSQARAKYTGLPERCQVSLKLPASVYRL